jgi:hypothetical protein
MSTSSGFTVTLPSTSNMDKHPANTGSLYTVALSSPLNFSGQTLNDDTRWQVAMLSLHYTHSFVNFREDCLLHFVVDKPAVGNIAASEAASNKVVATGDQTVDWAEFQAEERITHWIAETHIENSSPGAELVGSFAMNKQYYPSVLALCNDIAAKFAKLFFLRYKLKLIATMRSNGCITFTLSNGGKLAMYSNKSYISQILGLKGTLVSPASSRSADDKIEVFGLATVGTEKPSLKAVHALHVHADIVEPQHVGDVMVPLVGYVDVNGKPGDRISHTCNPPVYLPVAKSYIDAIRVRLNDERGENVMFPDLLDNVVLRLHFRKAKSVSFF